MVHTQWSIVSLKSRKHLTHYQDTILVVHWRGHCCYILEPFCLQALSFSRRYSWVSLYCFRSDLQWFILWHRFRRRHLILIVRIIRWMVRKCRLKAIHFWFLHDRTVSHPMTSLVTVEAVSLPLVRLCRCTLGIFVRRLLVTVHTWSCTGNTMLVFDSLTAFIVMYISNDSMSTKLPITLVETIY